MQSKIKSKIEETAIIYMKFDRTVYFIFHNSLIIRFNFIYFLSIIYVIYVFNTSSVNVYSFWNVKYLLCVYAK